MLFPVLCFFLLSPVYPLDIVLEWDPNTQPDLDYYMVFWGTTSGIYQHQSLEIDKSQTIYHLPELDDGPTYYFAIKAYDVQGRESNYSNEVVSSCLVGAPIVTGETPTTNITPTWMWNSGEGEGSGRFRYRLDNNDLSSGAEETDLNYFTPSTALAEGAHTLYVQEQDDYANWSSSGRFTIAIDTTEPTSRAITIDYANGIFSLAWTASDDNSGIASTELWHMGPGSSWTNSGVPAQTGTSGTFSYTITQSEQATEGTHYFATRSIDNAGNIEEEPSGEGDVSYGYEGTRAPGGGGCFINALVF